MKLLKVLGAVVAAAVVAVGGYVGIKALQGSPAAFVDMPAPISGNCKSSDVRISASAGDQVAWTVQDSDVTLVFQISPFTLGTKIPIPAGATPTRSGPLTTAAKACAAFFGVFNVTCDYPYTVTRNNTNCDPKVIVSR